MQNAATGVFVNWEAVGAIGEIIGATGVIASLIYLAIQLRHNTRQMEFNAKTTQVAAYQEITGRMVQNRQVMFSGSELPTLIEKVRSGESLGVVETRRYNAYVLSMISNADAAFFQHQQGLLSDERLLSLCRPLIRHIRQYPLGAAYWNIIKTEFVEDFTVYLDEHIANEKKHDVALVADSKVN